MAEGDLGRTALEARIVVALERGMPFDTHWRYCLGRDLPRNTRIVDDDQDAPFAKILAKYGPPGAQADMASSLAPEDPEQHSVFAYRIHPETRLPETESAVPAEAVPVEESTISAAFLRDILLPRGSIGSSGHIVQGAGTTPLPAGVQLIGVRVDGFLNLAWLEGEPYQGLPVLACASCWFPAQIAATRAHFSALAFADCIFDSFHASHAQLSSSLSLLNCKVALLDFAHTRIEGSVTIDQTNVDRSVDFQHAQIRGSIQSRGLSGPRGGGRASLDLNEARVGGAVLIHGFGGTSPLGLNAINCSVGGGWRMLGFRATIMDMRGITVGGDLHLYRGTCERVDIALSAIEGGLICRRLRGTEDKDELDATGALITKYDGDVDATGSSIGATSYIDDCALRTVLFDSAQVNGSLQWIRSNLATARWQNLEVAAELYVLQCEISEGVWGDSLCLKNGSLQFVGGVIGKEGCNLRHADIAGSVEFLEDSYKRLEDPNAEAPALQLVVKGTINLDHARIRGALRFVNTLVQNPKHRVALYATGASLDGGIEAQSDTPVPKIETVAAPGLTEQSKENEERLRAAEKLQITKQQAPRPASDESEESRLASSQLGSILAESRSQVSSSTEALEIPILVEKPGLRTTGGGVAFLSCTIGSRCNFEGAEIQGYAFSDESDINNRWKSIAFWMRDCKVLGPLRLTSAPAEVVAGRAAKEGKDLNPGHSNNIKGLVGIRNSEIEGNLELYGASFDAPEFCLGASYAYSNARVAIEIVGSHIGHDVHFDDPPPPQQVKAPASRLTGAALIRRCHIRGDVHLGEAIWNSSHPRTARPEEAARTAARKRDASGMPIAMSFRDTIIEGDVRLRRRVETGDGKSQRTVNKRLGIVDFTGTRLRAFDDGGGDAWGDMPEVTPGGDHDWLMVKGVGLRLEGCQFTRLGGRGARAEWLRRQWPQNRAAMLRHIPNMLGLTKKMGSTLGNPDWPRFNPEPNHIAAKALQAAGRHSEAYVVWRSAIRYELLSFSTFLPILHPLEKDVGNLSPDMAKQRIVALAIVAIAGFLSLYLANRQAWPVLIWILLGATGLASIVALGLLRDLGRFLEFCLAALIWAANFIYWAAFGWGYSSNRAVLSIIILAVVGFSFSSSMMRDEVLVSRAYVDASEQGLRDLPPRKCTTDSALGYTIDSMIVGVDLGPETRCTLALKPPDSMYSPVHWFEVIGTARKEERQQNLNFLKLVYSIVSSITLVLATLTFTRVLRRES